MILEVLERLKKTGDLKILLNAGYLSPSAFTHIDIVNKVAEYKIITRKNGQAVRLAAEFFGVSIQYIYQVLKQCD